MKMKRFIFIIFSFLIVFFFSGCDIDDNVGLNEEKDINNFVINSEQELIKYNGEASIIDIPEGVKVIKNGAFDDTIVFSISLPSTVVDIENEVFKDAYYLTEIYNYSELGIEIGSERNGGIAKRAKVIHTSPSEKSIIRIYLNRYVIADEVEQSTLIYYYGNQKDIIMPMQFDVIGDYAFYKNTNLNSIVFSQIITKIGDYAFAECRNLTQIFLSESIVEIGEYAFYNDYGLTRIKLRSNLETIGKSAFEGCYHLAEVSNLSLYLTLAIGSEDTGFVACYAKAIQNYSEEESLVKTYGNFVVYEDNDDVELINYLGLDTTVEIPENVTAISEYAFRGYDIYSIIIKGNVKQIHHNAFKYNYHLVEVFNLTGNDLSEYFPYAVNIFDNTRESSKLFVSNDYVYYLTAEKRTLIKLIMEGSYVLIDNVDDIFENAFLNNETDSILLSTNIKQIDLSCFANSNIESIYYMGSMDDLVSKPFGNEMLSSTLFRLYVYSEEPGLNNWHYEFNQVVIWS